MMIAMVSPADADEHDPLDEEGSTPDPITPSSESEPDAETGLYTIDELAGLSGVPSRTIRFYQSKGTLPAPERRGRVAYYGPEHVQRLKVIAELQDRGLRLDAIRDALHQVEQGGDSLQRWLGVGDRLQAPWSDDRPVVITEDDLLERTHSRPGIIAELRRLGVIERQGNSRPATFVVPSPGLLDIGLQLDEAGIDVVTAFEAGAIMRRRITKMADELVEYFSERAGQGFGYGGKPEEVARSFEALRPEGLRAVQLIFAQEMERSLRDFVERGGAIATRARKSDGRPEGRGERRPDRKADRKGERRGERHERRTPRAGD